MSAHVSGKPPRAAWALFLVLFAGIHAATPCVASDEDPYLWLEEVESEKALEWAKDRSERDTATIEAVPEFAGVFEALVEMYNSEDRIPTPAFQADKVYNFWQDENHVKGIWRRTSFADFASDEPVWETVQVFSKFPVALLIHFSPPMYASSPDVRAVRRPDLRTPSAGKRHLKNSDLALFLPAQLSPSGRARPLPI